MTACCLHTNYHHPLDHMCMLITIAKLSVHLISQKITSKVCLDSSSSEPLHTRGGSLIAIARAFKVNHALGECPMLVSGERALHEYAYIATQT